MCVIIDVHVRHRLNVNASGQSRDLFISRALYSHGLKTTRERMRTCCRSVGPNSNCGSGTDLNVEASEEARPKAVTRLRASCASERSPCKAAHHTSPHAQSAATTPRDAVRWQAAIKMTSAKRISRRIGATDERVITSLVESPFFFCSQRNLCWDRFLQGFSTQLAPPPLPNGTCVQKF